MILRCLEREPAHRFGNALEAVAALEERESAVGTGTPATATTATVSMPLPPSPKPDEPAARRRKRALIALPLLVAVALGVGVYRYNQWRERQQETRARLHLPEGPIVPRRSVAVLGFEDRSAPGSASSPNAPTPPNARPDAGWLGAALSEMLSTELASGDTLRVISGEEVARM